eukprot:6467820-Amphidinium_carterae.3
MRLQRAMPYASPGSSSQIVEENPHVVHHRGRQHLLRSLQLRHLPTHQGHTYWRQLQEAQLNVKEAIPQSDTSGDLTGLVV